MSVSNTLPLVLALATSGAGCRGSGAGDASAAARLRALERVILDIASTESHPTLTDPDLEPLRAFATSDKRVGRVRDACLRQYEAIVRAQDAQARCRTLEQMLTDYYHRGMKDAGDPALIIAEAEKACAGASVATDRIGQARTACDDQLSSARKALGLDR